MGEIIFDHTICKLGEGPLWHPLRQEFFWFDIQGKILYRRRLDDGDADGEDNFQKWQLDEYVSTAGWIDYDTLLVASQSALLRFDINTGASQIVQLLEANNPITRSNDGRADPWGGFWIGTMGINAEPDAGAIYRFYRGELRQLYQPISIANAICFSPGRRFGYFCDTTKRIIWRQPLAEIDGWPTGEPQIYLDFTDLNINPDGAVCDREGYLWNAQWGSARLARYSPEGKFDTEIKLPTDHITCPAFGGADLTTLIATSATQGLSKSSYAHQPLAGKTFITQTQFVGQKEHQIIL